MGLKNRLADVSSEEEAMVELAVSMIELAKEDYIKGAFVLIKKFARPMDLIVEYPPARHMIDRSRPGSKSGADRAVFWYKDALRFIKEDPYGLFSDPKQVIRTWNEEAWKMYRKKFA